MFGQKKAKKELKELKELPKMAEIPKDEPKEQPKDAVKDKKPIKAPMRRGTEKTPLQEVKILTEGKAKVMDFVLTEFKENYAGIFTSEQMPDIDAEATSLNLLIGIFSELRLIREILATKK